MTDAIDIAAPILVPDPAPEVPVPAVVPEVPVVPEEKVISITQTALDNLIRSRQAASLKKAATAEAEVARLKAIAVGTSEDASTVEKLRAEIAIEQSRSAAAEVRATQQEKAVLLAALGQGIDAVDPTSVGKLIADEIVNRDGHWVVVDSAGVEQTNVDGSPVSPEQHYKAWAASHLWAIKGRTLSGGGGTSSSGSPVGNSGRFTPEQIFGPKSSSKDAQMLHLKNPSEYARLKVLARQAGIL